MKDFYITLYVKLSFRLEFIQILFVDSSPVATDIDEEIEQRLAKLKAPPSK